MLDPARSEWQRQDPRDRLSARELEVLEMASLGLTNVQIAEELSVTIHAVKFHLAAVYRKLGVANRTEAAFLFLRTGGRNIETRRARL